MSDIKRGVAICHYNRLEHLGEIIDAVKETVPFNTRIVVCDDGSPNSGSVQGNADSVSSICSEKNIILLQGPNLGVAANKNRALWALQDCQYICILEDDLKPIKEDWFSIYEKASTLSGIHHFCRVQDKIVPETVPSFSAYMENNGFNPIYGPSPRGDLTFITNMVIKEIGGFNPRFRGAGYAHGEWSARVTRAGLINHPNKWIDIKQARDSFVQVGDTEGGRWLKNQEEITKQLTKNKKVLRDLQKEDYSYHPIILE